MKTTIRVLLVLSLVIVVLHWLTPSSVTPVQAGKTRANQPSLPGNSLREHLAQSRLNTAAIPNEVVPETETLARELPPKPMNLDRKVLAHKEWNSAPEAFGREMPREGAIIGPAAVVYANSNIYVLDTINSRIQGYDKAGNMVSTVALPTQFGADLAVDPSDGSLVMVDHLKGDVYKIAGDQVTHLATNDIKQNFDFGTKFSYDAATGDLAAERQRELADIWDNKTLVIDPHGDKPLTIPFDKPVACVEEAVTDAQGNLWVLFTLEGDYRMRRLARVDADRKTVGVAEIDAWFAFDVTRRMTPTENGVVLVAGDEQEGRLLSFDYAGILQ